MRDEDLREVQREARLEEGLAALIECLRNGHQPIFDAVGNELKLALIVPGASDMGLLQACRRCRLTYWALPKTQFCANADRQRAHMCRYSGTCETCIKGERR